MTSYERSDANTVGILGGALVLLVALALVLIVVTWFAAASTGIPVSVGRPSDLIAGTSGGPTPPPPRLESEPGGDLTAYRSAAEQRLQSYGWVDKQAGTVHIPIDEAKARVVERGRP